MADKMKTKQEFAWDTEELVKTIEVSAYEKREVRITTLKEKQYVVVTTVKKIKDEWKPVKGATFPMSVWNEIVDAIGAFQLNDAKKTKPKAPKGKKTAGK